MKIWSQALNCVDKHEFKRNMSLRQIVCSGTKNLEVISRDQSFASSERHKESGVFLSSFSRWGVKMSFLGLCRGTNRKKQKGKYVLFSVKKKKKIDGGGWVPKGLSD